MNGLNKLQNQLNEQTMDKQTMKKVKGGGWFSDMLYAWWESSHNGCPPPDAN